ncbi:MAG: LacI family DNA-binding transcriptional regulator, partial [Pseudomonadota bacterium]
MARTVKKVSIRDVAAVAGVSTATVSNVLSGKKAVKSELQEKVHEAANKLGYEVDRAASLLRSGRSNIIAVIVPDLEDLFLTRLVALMEARAQNAGYEVIVTCSRNDPAVERSRLRALLAWRPAGIFAVPCGDTLPEELTEKNNGTPVVGADRILPDQTPFDSVTLDNQGSGKMVAQLLLEKNAKSILFVAATLNLFTIRERVKGARDALKDDSQATLDVLEIGTDPADGAKLVSDWLEHRAVPDAVIAGTNVGTLAVLSAFAERQLDTPDDVLLVGFHDSLWMTARRRPVTTVAQPVDAVAKYAWERLERRMAG